MEAASNKNLVDETYERILQLLSDRIWTGTENLSDAGLAQGLGVSRTPVRMALSRLESEGLVRKAPNKGWSPIPLTLKDIEDIFDLKEALEVLAVRRAAARITPQAAAILTTAIADMQSAATTDDLRRWISADDRFHQYIYEVVGNERLARSMGWLDAQWYRFRMGYLAQEGDLTRLYAEHLAIAEAIAGGNDDAAANAIAAHLGHVRDAILRITRDVLMPFTGMAGAPGGRGGLDDGRKAWDQRPRTTEPA